MNIDGLHYEYHKQFASSFHSSIRAKHTKEEWAELLEQDEHLNNVPIKYWQELSVRFQSEQARVNESINGSRTWSIATGVCGAKAAVKMYVMEG